MKICEYGCNKEGKYQFKNGKWCCSINHKKCTGLSYTYTKISKITCSYCNKQISKNRIKHHIQSCKQYNICLQCNNKTKNPKFCDNKCSAIYNNKHSKKLRAFQNKKIEDGIKNRGLRKDQIPYKYVEVNKCLYCKKPVNYKFCNNTCKTQYRLQLQIEKWINGEINGCSKGGHAGYVKKYLLQKYDNKCCQCGWGETNPYTKTIPLEVEHMDGNCYNNTVENVILVCPNCHSLTKTYRGANSGHGRRSYLKKYYIKDNKGRIISG